MRSVYAGSMPTVYDVTKEDLSERLVAWNEPAFRAKQLWARAQLWKRGATYDQMSDISPALRERLATELPLGVELLVERTADRGATRKALLRLGGEHSSRDVRIGYRDRLGVSLVAVGVSMGARLRDPVRGTRTTDGGRDRGPGRLGTPGSRRLMRARRSGSRSVVHGMASRSRTTPRFSAIEKSHRPTDVRSGGGPSPPRSGSCPHPH